MVKYSTVLMMAWLSWLPAMAASPFDGSYAGQRTSVRGSAPHGPKEGQSTWRITDGKLNYKFWAGTLPVTVAADGAVDGKMQYSPRGSRTSWGTVRGAIANGTLEADTERQSCKVHYVLKKSR